MAVSAIGTSGVTSHCLLLHPNLQHPLAIDGLVETA